jgi:hypothetical protein
LEGCRFAVEFGVQRGEAALPAKGGLPNNASAKARLRRADAHLR